VSGAVSAGSVAKFGKVVGARLIVTASITDFENSVVSRGGSASASKEHLGGLAGSEQIDATVRDVNFGAFLAVDQSLLVRWLESLVGTMSQKARHYRR